MKRLIRQGTGFLVVGLVQLAIDWALFVILTAAGMAVVPANLLARVSAACLGFWLNGRYTFAEHGRARLGRQRFARFALAWIALTAASTLGMEAVARLLGLHWAWLAKPVVDGGLAVLSFVLLRQWVYR
ncbi:GtrA family protein [Rehaibacterium terrae]|uniref:Putative flippase GtrA n=1 Tax=Rehaibacterium terrae TaxID=1341696 RepID=A0A7W8DFH9_9GAMM|nr:GtrA family protein [Rehaibacterium terrae]MBB5016396.1 putative flippase GtrA [Rehaibacterium terrae]